MEVMIPTAAAAAVEFNFDSACTTPYISAPSSPQRFGSNFFYSAPTSPTRLISSTFYSNDHDHYLSDSPSSVPFDWEEKPGIPYQAKSTTATDDDDDDFAFDFSGQLDGKTSLTTADELFDGGKIKPLKPPPTGLTTPPNNKQMNYKDALFSPRRRQRKKACADDLDDLMLDPFAAALEQTTTGNNKDSSCNERGRERMSSTAGAGAGASAGDSRNMKKSSGRSLSPFRVSDLLLDDSEGNEKGSVVEDDPTTGEHGGRRFSTSSLVPSSFVSFWYRRKWKLKDLLLFRSASDGHTAMTKEQMNKYATLKEDQEHERGHEDVKSSSFRSTESCGSSSSTSRPRKGAVSAHELHYRTKRAMAQDMKRKTSLPYKPPGFFGCLGYNPAGSSSSIHDISRNLGASSISHFKQ